MEIGEPSICTLPGEIAESSSYIAITRPGDYTLWPLLHEPERSVYLTQGIAQGAALWTGAGTSVAHGADANASGDRTGAAGTQVRAQERGLVVQGVVVSEATAVRIHILDAARAAIPLKTNPTATATPQIEVIPAAAEDGAGLRLFEAVVFLDAPETHFGPVQVHAEAVGVPPPAEAVSHVLLVGVQIALVDDRASNIDGRVRGPLQTEADEKFVIDFIDSPRGSVALISEQTRARRMNVYEISFRPRMTMTVIPAIPMTVPEMPMWMVELQLIGVDGASLAAFLLSRGADSGRLDLPISAEWQLQMSWDGPNAGSNIRPYRYQQDWTMSTTIRIMANATGSNITSEVTPAPAVVAFPVAGRRTAQVVSSGVNRPWGRRSGAITRPVVIVEYQPRLVIQGNEVIRGGDGELTLTSLKIDGEVIDPGRLPADPVPTPPPASTPVAMLPTFRVKGINLPAADRRPLVDALVTEYVQLHGADAWVAMLALGVWQETTWLVLAHESIGGSHFEHRGTGRRRYDGRYFGHEQDMPMFGAPAGYGWGQMDNPPVTNNAAWSFADNARAAIELLIGGKARAAYVALSPHFANPPARSDKAAFRRDTVRRYNGNSECRWNGTSWEINPTSAQTAGPGVPNPRLQYPNDVLGTTVIY